MNDLVISSAGLSKSYSGKPALRDLNLSVPCGSISGFLGRNGAGKTTTLKLLMGILRPDHGDIRIFGESMRTEQFFVAARRRMAFVSEEKDSIHS